MCKIGEEGRWGRNGVLEKDTDLRLNTEGFFFNRDSGFSIEDS